MNFKLVNFSFEIIEIIQLIIYSKKKKKKIVMNGEKHEVLIGKGLCLMSIGIEKTEENKKKEAKTKLEESIIFSGFLVNHLCDTN